ncbi:AI-2E family transporter [Phormidesmis priestleyi ULC007]|uniref:AI-2E family transporter n=1 Tax=Phormidesmis priestleyi ULC007 TaxID=1920490 RepID=A0A2T1DNC0_9CYAN|nr:AI-2E family transporter [Phormidesmis priestleyi]PSB21997.1 AI-2E family transporter [Phormidesmis priestleyi ULC007]PZO55035.1 MAG: AI-2E family transporter [Phormidesmis priestleyi]
MRPPTSPPPSSNLWQTLNHSTLFRYILLVGCGWITVLLINYFHSTIALFTAAGIFAALLNYPSVWLSRYIPRGLAIALTFIVTVALLLVVVTFVGIEVLNQGQGLLIHIRDALDQQNALPFQDLLNRLDIGKVVGTLQTGLTSGLGIVRGIFSSLFTGIFGAVICIYMLIDGEKLWQSFLKLIPVASRDRFARTFRQSFLGFIRGQLLLMLFLSSTTGLIFPLLGVRYSLLLAVILGIIDAIPGIGATLGTIIVVFLVFTSQGGAIALKVLIVCLVLIQIQDNVIRPKVMGSALELNPVVLFLALFIGERVAGLLGVFLAIPIAGMIALWMGSVKEEADLALKESTVNVVEPSEKS